MRMALFIFEYLPRRYSMPRSEPGRLSCGNAISRLCECSAQFVLHHFACRAERQSVQKLYVPRDLEASHPVSAPGHQFFHRHRALATALQHHERLADLPEAVVGHTDHGGLSDSGMLQQETLDLSGVGVEAADDEHVLLAADDQ